MTRTCRSPRLVYLLSMALFAGAFPARATTIEEIPSPRPTGWSVDLTGSIPSATRQEIDRLGDQVKATNGAELTVVVIDSTGGVPARDFAVRLFDHWGIGASGKDNGVLLFAALSDRSAEIVLGRGLDTPANNQTSAEIMQGEMVPLFRAGDPGGALLAGARACAGRILGVAVLPPSAAPLPAETETPMAPLVAAPETSSPSTEPVPSRSGPSPLVGYFVVTLFILGVAGTGYFLLRAPRCQHCRIAMTKLDEQADDKYLTPVEKTEERVGSIDHQIWTCLQCGERRKRSRTLFSSSRETCSRCGAKAVESTEQIVVSATYDHAGKRRIETLCAHCNRRDAHDEIISQLTRPTISSSDWSSDSSSSSHSSTSSDSSSSSYSSSGSSGFGGGHSSGGGASGKW